MESIKSQKKGQLAGLTPALLALIVAIIALVVGMVVVQEIRDADLVDQALSESFANETLTTVDENGETLSCGTYPAGLCGTVLTVTNQTEGTVIPAGNFTQTNCNIALNAPDDDFGFNGTNWNVTYSCSFGDTAWVSGNQSLAGLGDFSEFIPIIVIALAASIVIGLILVGFAFSRRQR